MEQTKNQKDVLIVRDEQTGEIGVVSGLNRDGTPKTTAAKAANGKDFLHFDRHGDVLDNFFKNFYLQCKEPTRFGFYRLAVEGVENVLEVMKDLLKDPEANKEMLASHKVDTTAYQQGQESEIKENQKEEKTDETMKQDNKEEGKKSYQPIDESRINWQQLEEQYGVKRQSLEESGDLEKMLNYGKSNLMTVSPKFGDEQFETEARLSFKVQEDGNVKLTPHLMRKEPQLDKPFYGYTFSSEDKENLKATGNMGRIAEFTDKKTGEVKQSFISVDRQTNEIISIPVSKVRIPNKIGETTFTEQEKAILKSGQPLPNKEITLANGKKFTATLQVNVEQKGVEFVPRSGKQVSQNKKQEPYQPKQEQGGEEPKKKLFKWTDENGNLRAPKTFGGVALTPEQQKDFTAGKAILVQDMKNDAKGKSYTAYVKFNFEEGRPRYSRTNPDVSQGQEVAVAQENKTQVAVNSHGKTNEATKHLNEPLNQNQVAPKNEEQQKRSKGIKM